MESFLDLLGVGASVASGGIFGAIGAVVGAISKSINASQEHKRKLELLDWDLKMFNRQQAADQAETEREIAVASAQGAWEGLNTSIRADNALAKHTGEFVNGVKSLFRPFLTLSLTGSTVWIFYLIWSDFANATSDSNLTLLFTETEIKELLKYMVYSQCFATMTAIVWWFGDRALAPPGMKNR